MKRDFLRFVFVLTLFILSQADEGEDDFQCHILYEFDATTKGQVTSPFYGKRDTYHNGLWCEYRIRAPEGYKIKITIKDLDIQASGSCMQDKLIVYGKDKTSILGLFCGSRIPHPLLSNEGESEVRLLFETDFMVGGRGFLLEYESSPYITLCEHGYSVCGNRNCFNETQKCNGVDDCGDGTDEEDCGFPFELSPTECGTPPIPPKTIYGSPDRMVGGEEAIPNSWPWQASLQMSFSEPNGHFCGGTLINAQWVLTAGHCVKGFPNPNDIKVHLGAHSNKKTPYEQVRRAAKIISYPDLEFGNLKAFSFNHDITLIKLNAPVKFNDGVQPACLPSLGWELQPGWICYATGWGETRGSGASGSLKQMEQIIQPEQNCSVNQATQICVAKLNNSPCHGDSGGPLQCRLAGKWYVFGAASYVTTTNMMTGLCAGAGSKTVFANVADKADWIKVLVNKYS